MFCYVLPKALLDSSSEMLPMKLQKWLKLVQLLPTPEEHEKKFDVSRRLARR